MSTPVSILAFALVLCFSVVVLSSNILVSFPNTLKLGVPNNVVVHLQSSRNHSVCVMAYNDGRRVAQTCKLVVSGGPTTMSLTISAKDIDGGRTGSPCDQSVSLLVKWPTLGLTRQVDVAVDCSGASVFIFTDKSVYTPGQTVYLRVACLDWTLKIHFEKLTVDIKNPQGIIIRRWTTITSTLEGLFDETFIIDDEPQLGLWTVSVHSGRDSKAMPMGNSTFEVKEYVVPRFGVSITSPDYIKNSSKLFQVIVEARYTYGEAVRGKASIEFGALYENNYRPVVRLGYEEWTKSLTEGRAIYNIKLKTITDGLPYGFPLGGRLKVKARVTNDGVGASEETSVERTVFSVKSALLDISRSRGFFKPGLPYDIEVLARKPNGVPIAKQNIILQAFFKTKGQEEWAQVSLLGHGGSVRQTDVNGFADFVINIPRQSTKLKLQLKADGDSWTETELFPEASSLNEKYILVRGSRNVHKVCSDQTCGKVEFSVYSSHSGITVNLCHMLICRGVIAVSECRSVSSWPTGVYVEFRPFTSPCCKLIVFYQDGGAFVADSIVVYSQMAFPNKIAVKREEMLQSRFYFPKAEVDLEISGLPGSMVYLSAVDEGVLLLGDNRLTAVEVLNRMRGCKLGCESIGGRDADGIFKNAGLVYASLNKKIDYSPICFPVPKLEPTPSNLEACCERGVKHCQECNVHRQLLVDEGIHSDLCIQTFSDCCEKASKFYVCTLHGRGRNQGGRIFLNGEDLNDLPTKYRSYFPESWLNRVEVISNRGVKTVKINVPDTITTWEVNAIGTSRSGLFGMAEPIRLRVSSILFLDVSMPYSVVRNEQFAVKATVFNYNKISSFNRVHVELVSKSDNLCTTAGTGEKTERQTIDTLHNASSHTLIFPVVPLAVGDIKIEVVLTSTLHKESVKKTIRVKPEGVEEEIAYSTVIDPSAHGGIQNVSYNLASPYNTIKGSARSYLYATGNLLGSVVALEGFEELVQQPYGCGEQNMIIFCTNVVVLLYMNRTDQLNKTLETKGVDNIRHGYSRQLLFRRTDPPGSFSAFGNSDPHGSTWLTAFVVKCFCKVKHLQLTDEVVDRSVVKTALKWLLTQQLPSGVFVERGRVLDIGLQGSQETFNCSLASYVLISYLECSANYNFSAKLAESMSLAIRYVTSCVNISDPCSNTFELAISGYALCLANEKQLAAQILGMLWNNANVNTREDTADWIDTSTTRAAAIETAAYALLGFMCIDNLPSASRTANWLNSQRSLGGGFLSTQDTVLALQALAAYAERRHGKASSLEVSVASSSNKYIQPINIDKLEANVRQNRSIAPNSAIDVVVKGSGVGLLQAGLKYNILQRSSKCHFSIETETTFGEKTNKLTISINVRYSAKRESKRAVVQEFEKCKTRMAVHQDVEERDVEEGRGEIGMAVVEVRLLSGFQADVRSLEKVISNTNEIRRYDNTGGTINFYLDKISSQTPTSFAFKAERKLEVGFLQSAPIRVYDYYNPDISCTTFYAPDGESPLLQLLCKGTTCQCGAGKCPYCDKLDRSRQVVGKDRSTCEDLDMKSGEKRTIRIKQLPLRACDSDFAYKLTVTRTRTSCKNGWTKVLAKLDKILKPGVRNIQPGDRIRVWKRADCSCPSFRVGESYLYIGYDGPKFLVDYNSVVLKWDNKLFRSFVTKMNKRAVCEYIS